MSKGYAVVIGGVNVDIGGISAAPLVSADSNPGKVRISLGGVGRNIAHNMALLGVDVKFLTAFGDDLHAQRLISSCGELGIDVSRALTVPGAATSTYLFISGPDGDMALAVSDMDIYSHVTPDYLAAQKDLLDGAGVVIVDANIPARSIEWLAENVAAPLFADPVSTAKAAKLTPVLGRLHTLKPNRIEAQLLSGVSIPDGAGLQRAAQVLLSTGLERVFLSAGGEGVYAADRGGGCMLPAFPARVANATGAGDAFMAALGWAWLEGFDLEKTALLAQAAAAIAIEGTGTINPALSPAAVLARAGFEN